MKKIEMGNFLKIFPDQIIRLVIVFGILIIGVWIIRNYVIPSEFKETGFQRSSAIERELSKETRYAGSRVCSECHDEEYGIKKTGYHKNLSCEVCHGPAMEHTEEPFEITPRAPRERKFCPLCHTYNLSRPTGFPQINPIVHNPLEPCITCHDPHDPEPPEVPRECTACHEKIARTKAVSPHVMLECTTCHVTPEEHKIRPRLIRPTKPSEREFCAKCHGKTSTVKKPPKIDLITHGEKYLCWQCHYPHMPEVK